MQTYFAKSLFSSKTFWFNLLSTLVLILQANEVITILPPSSVKYTAAAIAIVNIVLRVMTVRPVAVIAPGDSLPVRVPSLPLIKE